MAIDNSKPVYPTRQELRRLSPYDGSLRLIAAFDEARAYLRAQGNARPTLDEACEVLGESVSPSTYQSSINHVRAVKVYGMSPNLAKMEAVARMRRIEPIPLRVSGALATAEDKRSDPEILADAVSNVLVKATDLTKLDVGVLASHLTKNPTRQGATVSAIVDLRRWLDGFERALSGSLKR